MADKADKADKAGMPEECVGEVEEIASLPLVSSREGIVKSARLEYEAFIDELWQKHSLTTAEMLQLLSYHQSFLLSQLVQAERRRATNIP